MHTLHRSLSSIDIIVDRKAETGLMCRVDLPPTVWTTSVVREVCVYFVIVYTLALKLSACMMSVVMSVCGNRVAALTCSKWLFSRRH